MKIGSGWPTAVFFSLAFLCFTPLLFYPHNYSSYLYPKLLFLSCFLFLGLLCWTFDSLLARGGQPPWDGASLALLGFLAWALFRYPWFSSAHAHLRNPFLWGNLCLLYFLARQYGREEKRAQTLVHLLAWAGVAICLYGLLQFFGIDLSLYRSPASIFGSIRPEGKWGRPFSTLGNPNFLGEFLAALLPLTLALYLSSCKRIQSYVLGGLSLASALLILVSGARGALLASAGGLILFFWLDRGKSHLRKALLLLLVGVVLASGFFFVEGMRSGLSRTWNKVSGISAPGQGSLGARLLWWRVSLEMIQAHSLLGSGTGTFREAYPIFQRKFFEDPASAPWIPQVGAAWKENYNATVEAPHNEYLQMAAEMGLPGVFLFVAFTLFLLRGEVRKRPPSPPSWRNGCAAACFSVLVASLFGFPLHLPSTGVAFFLLAGLISRHEGKEGELEEGKGKGDPLFGTLLVLIACLALLQLIHQAKVYVSGRHLYQAIGYQLSVKTDRALGALAEAKRLNPKDPEIDYWIGLTHLSAGRLHSAKGFLEKTKASLNSPRLYLTLGAIHGDLHDPRSAETLYREGIATYPGLAPLHARLGALYAQEGRFPRALQELEQARSIDPFYAETHHFLGHLFYRLGRTREAKESLGRFLQLAPTTDTRRPLDLDLMRRIKPSPKSP